MDREAHRPDGILVQSGRRACRLHSELGTYERGTTPALEINSVVGRIPYRAARCAGSTYTHKRHVSAPLQTCKRAYHRPRRIRPKSCEPRTNSHCATP